MQSKGKPPLASAPQASPPDAGEAAAKAKADRKERGAALSTLAEAQKRDFAATAKQREAAERERVATKRAEEAEKLLADAKNDPMGFLERGGIKMRQIAERVAKGEPVTDANKALLDRVVAMEAENERIREEGKQREAKAQSENEFEKAKRDLAKVYDETKGALPHFARIVKKYGDATLVTEVQAMYREIQSDERTKDYADQYTFAEVLEAIEAKWADRAEALKEEAEAPAPASNGAAAPAGPKPSLTNASASASSVLPTDYKKLTPQQQKEADRAAYRALRKK